MRHLVLLLALALFTLPQYTTAQEDYSITISVNPEDADWNNFPGWVTFYGEIRGPELNFPVDPTIQITYRIDSLLDAPGYLGVFQTSYNQETGSYSIAFELLGGQYQNASRIYLGGSMAWLDLGIPVVYAEYETSQDSLIAIDLPWLVTGVNQNESEVFSAYPNPTAGELSLTGLGTAKTISIYDVFGRMVLTTSAHRNLDVSNLSRGHYVLRTDTGLIHTLIKN